MNNTPVYDASAPKQTSNLSINSNLSGLLEQALIQKLTEKKRTEWLEENRASLEAYNQRIEKRGVFSDDPRTF